MSIEAMKQALEALTASNSQPLPWWVSERNQESITSLRQAIREHALREVQRLGQEIEQEWSLKMNDRQRLETIVSVVCKYLPPDGISKDQALNEIIGLVDPLPPQRTWVGLTDEERNDLCYDFGEKSLWSFADSIEAKLKEKNCL